MSNPTAGDVHVNVPLTTISLASIQAGANFIADKMYPNIPVMKQSDRYFRYSRADFNRNQMQRRAPSSESAGGGYNIDSSPTYFAEDFALHKDISDRIRANADNPLNMDRDASLWLANQAMIQREVSFVANHFSTGKWSTEVTGVDASPSGATEFLQWGDEASTPITDIRQQKAAILEATGFEPNKLTLGYRVYNKLIDHPEVIERVKFGQTPGGPARANANVLAQILEVDEVLVAKAVYNTGAEGTNYTNSQANEASTFIAGDHALLAYVNPTPSILTPSAGYTFSWTDWLGATTLGYRIKTFRIERLASDRVEIEMAYDQKQVMAELGAFFKHAVASAQSS
jgi:hypothetical protein